MEDETTTPRPCCRSGELCNHRNQRRRSLPPSGVQVSHLMFTDQNHRRSHPNTRIEAQVRQLDINNEFQYSIDRTGQSNEWYSDMTAPHPYYSHQHGFPGKLFDITNPRFVQNDPIYGHSSNATFPNQSQFVPRYQLNASQGHNFNWPTAEQRGSISRIEPGSSQPRFNQLTQNMPASRTFDQFNASNYSGENTAFVDLTDDSQNSGRDTIHSPSLTATSPSSSPSTDAGLNNINQDRAHQERKPAVVLAAKRKRKEINNFVSEAVAIPKRIKTVEIQAVGKPEVWADRRQQLCEALPYFKSYQGSWYIKDGKALSMLLSQDETARSYKDSQIVIARAPGGMSSDVRNRKPAVRVKGHADNDASVIAISQACQQETSVIVLASNQCPGLPTQMPHNYQVLGHYWITNYWWEKQDGFDIFKYRLERCDLSTQAWYAPVDEEFTAPDFSVTCDKYGCRLCGRTYARVYQEWMCLNVRCYNFWKRPNGEVPNEGALTFNEAFLSKRSNFSANNSAMHEYVIKPKAFDPSTGRDPQYAFSRDGWTGFCCSECGRCTSREDWSGWKCPCGTLHTVKEPLLTPEHANMEYDSMGDLVPLTPLSISSELVPTRSKRGKYILEVYKIDDNNSIHHFKSCPELNSQPNGPNQLFKDLQLAKGMNMKRRIVGSQSDKTMMAMLTRHFSQNYGLQYKYVVAQDSTPFKDAPSPICLALQRLKWAGKATGMDPTQPFNEMLVVGYRESGSMGYHDDGEKDLGSTVSTLSLGGDAIMRFRYKAKYWFPPLMLEPGKFVPDERVFPNVPLERQRKGMLRWIEDHPGATKAEMHAQFKKSAAVKTYLETKKNAKNAKDMVQILLKHGDIVIMKGAELQQYMEHQVEARGCLRFALTSRHVLPQTVRPQDRHMGDVDLSAYPEYDGDNDCKKPENIRRDTYDLEAAFRIGIDDGMVH